jgi:hypothetical protein
MGKRSKEKWMKRAEVYEGIVLRKGPETSKEYLDRFQKKLGKFMKGVADLEEEREIIEEEEMAGREPEPD